MAVEIEGLEFQIEAKSENAAKGVDALINSFNKLKAATKAMEDFYHEYVEPTMVQMADDMRRQADKEEKTVVQVGNRVVTDAVTTQKKANGYSFTG